MADLDDFFTKRDKKKKPAAKSKFSVLDTEDIAKQLEATCKVAAVVDGDENAELDPNTDELGSGAASSAALPTSNQNTNSGENQDEEWKPFDSDENKDYSGLRINIQNWKVEDEENNYEETNEDNEKKAACPWGAANIKAKLAKSQEAESVDKVEEPVEKPSQEATPIEETSKSESSESPANGPATTTTAEAVAPTPGAYIPPALKRQMEAAAAAAGGSSASSAAAPTAPSAPVGKYIPPSMRNKAPEGGSLISNNAVSSAVKKPGKAQPNIMDTFEFPTLDSGAPSSETGDKLTNGNSDKFEMAKKGSRTDGAKTGKSNTIDLENKFTALDASSNH